MHVQDVWLVLDINANVGEPALANMRSYIRMLTGNFPVSQVILIFYEAKLWKSL